MYVSDNIYYGVQVVWFIFGVGAFAGLSIWMFIVFNDQTHPNLCTDDNGQKYCPALKALSEAKRMQREQQFKVSSPRPNLPPIPDLRQSRDTIGQLERLVSLRERGVLTAEEFETQKRRLLN